MANTPLTGNETPTTTDHGTPITHYSGKLANGHYLVLREFASKKYDAVGPLLQELDAKNNVVWELQFPAGNGFFAAQRISPPPRVQKL